MTKNSSNISNNKLIKYITLTQINTYLQHISLFLYPLIADNNMELVLCCIRSRAR